MSSVTVGFVGLGSMGLGMAKNALQNLEQVLREEDQEIQVAPDIRDRAILCIQRMLKFAEHHGISGALKTRDS